MLAIRLTRMGAKKQPSYRIVVTRKRYKRDGRYVAKLGYYNPLTEPATVVVDKEQFDYWVKNGAQPSDVVKRIVLGITGTKKKAPKKSVETKEETREQTATQSTEVTENVTEPETVEKATDETAADEASETTEENTEQAS